MELVEVNLAHAHCSGCFNRHCTFIDDPVVTCLVGDCDLRCGARFHECKRVEHEELCPTRRVPCINAVYGCTALLPRSVAGAHLQVCPASVVHCTMEWNRWPVYSTERQSHQPPTQLVPSCEESAGKNDSEVGPLDIALALRDQRMLTRSMRASRSTRAILTTSVNRKHPAVPLDRQLTCDSAVDEIKELEHLLRTMQDEKTEEERRRARTPPGLRDSICLEMMTNRQKQTAGPYDPPYYPPEIYASYPYIHCSHCEKRKERLERILGPQEDQEEGGQLEGDGGAEDHQMGPRENGCHSNGDCNGDTSSHSSTEMEPPALFVTSSTTGDLSAAPSRGYAKLLVVQPQQNTVASFSKNSLGLDISMESITKYQAKPDSMYTFLCAQEFRRDEFASHFKNVHSDIHGGLNGWLEQRCPLAPYGCTYSQRRFYPGVHGARIVHSEKLESFGLQIGDGATGGGGDDGSGEIGQDHLSKLPFELLQYLFGFLDSFSLCNMAMVARLPRQVCNSLLEERGMVILVWEKQPSGWQVSYKAWMYSTSFTPVNSWGFEDYTPIGQHLQQCPYNVRSDYPDKVKVMGREAPPRKKREFKEE